MIRVTLFSVCFIAAVWVKQATAIEYCGPSAEAALSEVSSVFSKHLGISEITRSLADDILVSSERVESLYLAAHREFAENISNRDLSMEDIENSSCKKWVSELRSFSAFINTLKNRLGRGVYNGSDKQELEVFFFNEYLGEVLKGFR